MVAGETKKKGREKEHWKEDTYQNPSFTRKAREPVAARLAVRLAVFPNFVRFSGQVRDRLVGRES